MSQIVVTATKSFTAGAAIAQFLRVKIASGVLAAAGVGDQDIGVLEEASFASGDVRAVRLRSAQGTHKAIAASAIAAGALVYTAASGKVNDTAATGSFLRGVAMEASSADGDVIEIMPLCGDSATA